MPLVYKNSISLMASSFSPIFLLGEKLPIMLKPVWGTVNVAVYVLFCLFFASTLSYRFLSGKVKFFFKKEAFVQFWKNGNSSGKNTLAIGLAMIFFMILQAFLMKMHPVVSGAYYYSSLFSILTPIFIVLLFGRGRSFFEDASGRVLIVVLMTVQLVNFYDLNSRWMLFHKQWIHLESINTFPELLRSDGLIKNEAWINKVGLPYKSDKHIDGLDRNYSKEKEVWQGWKKGAKYDLDTISDFTDQDALFLHEMDVLMKDKASNKKK